MCSLATHNRSACVSCPSLPAALPWSCRASDKGAHAAAGALMEELLAKLTARDQQTLVYYLPASETHRAKVYTARTHACITASCC